MIQEYQRIDLFGKMLFERSVVKSPFKLSSPMTNQACFIFVLEGNFRIYSEADQVQTSERDGILMKCGNYFAKLNPSANGLTKAVVVHFYPEVLKKIYIDDIPGFLKKQNQHLDPPMVQVKSDVLVQKYFESMIFYFENPELVTEELLILKTKELFLLLDKTKNSESVRALLSNLFSPKTYTFKEIVNAHIYDQISLTDLSELCNMSLSSFKREFNRIYQEAPARYIKMKKLEKVKNLLEHSDKNISEIAVDCGFGSLVSLSTSFQNEFSNSPSDYRKKVLSR